MIDFLPHFLQYDFMQRAILAGIMISIIAPVIGIFLVVKRYSLMTDTLAHVSLLGVAMGTVFGVNPVLMAIIISVFSAIGIEKLKNSKKVFGESALSVFLSGSLAVSIIILSLSRGNINLTGFLFGSITTVAAIDIAYILFLGAAVLFFVYLFFKELFLTSFDNELAQANGLRVNLINLLLVVSASITIALAIRIVGILLVGALMVIPVLSAMQFGKGFKITIVLSVAFSLISVLFGLTFSYYFNLPSGGAIVLVLLTLFTMSLFIKKR